MILLAVVRLKENVEFSVDDVGGDKFGPIPLVNQLIHLSLPKLLRGFAVVFSEVPAVGRHQGKARPERIKRGRIHVHNVLRVNFTVAIGLPPLQLVGRQLSTQRG